MEHFPQNMIYFGCRPSFEMFRRQCPASRPTARHWIHVSSSYIATNSATNWQINKHCNKLKDSLGLQLRFYSYWCFVPTVDIHLFRPPQKDGKENVLHLQDRARVLGDYQHWLFSWCFHMGRPGNKGSDHQVKSSQVIDDEQLEQLKKEEVDDDSDVQQNIK